ncbi:MAG: YaaR family protein [Lachnospiraceae bacterium]|nr:YaaR family protein [Lachnospiraceae bacterium]MCR5310047.1 YaaR family protein [Lachnospiraceae bacterium]
MDVKITQVTQATQVQPTQAVQPTNEEFKFMLMSRIAEEDLQARLSSLMNEISEQGERIAKKKDIKDMRRYRSLIKDFMNEIVSRSHAFSRENFLDRKGRHRVYGIIRLVDQNLDELAEELLKEQKDNLSILQKIGDIRGLILDIFT